MRKWILKHGHIVCALVASLAPVVNGFCKGFFYEETEPEGLKEFAER